MSNEILFFIELVCCFFGVVLFNKLFGKYGLISWVAIASILANLITAKSVDGFGLSYTLGTILFASTFLSTDILTELYGKEYAKKAVYIGMASSIAFIAACQLALLYTPAAFDYADPAMKTLFSLNIRISIASVIMYFVANLADVYLYDFLKTKMNGRKMWVRNNVATLVCNCLENFLFMLGAFLGIYDFTTVMLMAVSTSVIEMIAGVLDTPFLYLATMSTNNKKEIKK